MSDRETKATAKQFGANDNKPYIGKLLLFIVVPSLYMIGWAYRIGYISGLGLPIELFSLSANEYIAYAYFPLLAAIVGVFGKFDALLLGILFVVGVAAIVFWISAFFKKRYSHKLKPMFGKLKGWLQAHHLWVAPTIAVSLLGYFSVVILYMALLVAMIPVFSYEHGKTRAISDLDNFVKCDARSNKERCLTVTVGTKTIIGEAMISSDKFTAVFDGGQIHILDNTSFSISADLTSAKIE